MALVLVTTLDSYFSSSARVPVCETILAYCLHRGAGREDREDGWKQKKSDRIERPGL